MSRYTFETLSPTEFEELVQDLLTEEWGLRFQSFAPGPDWGIDLLHAEGDGNIIIQCKRYAKTAFAALARVLEREELPKLRSLPVTRYILCTSVSMTPHRKTALQSLLAPYCRSIHDILGLEDLNYLLRKHDSVEMRHTKLYLSSAAILRRIVNGAGHAWALIQKEEIKRVLSLYVDTPARARANEILQHYRYCVISGAPGVGKTTLARILISLLTAAGFQAVIARTSLRELLDAFEPTSKQVYYFDDFLGKASLRERHDYELAGLTDFLRVVACDPSKRLILTTREYLLQEAKEQREELDRCLPDSSRCILELSDYNILHKARILYNHLYFSSLSQQQVAAVADGGYVSIVSHPAFTPRIIEWMTSHAAARYEASQYVPRFLDCLDDPEQIWRHAFDQHLTDEGRLLLFTLATLPGATTLSKLEDAWNALMTATRSSLDAAATAAVFRSSLKQCDGSFIRVDRVGLTHVVTIHNATLEEFIRRRAVASRAVARQLAQGAIYFEQLTILVSVAANGRVGIGCNSIIDEGLVVQRMRDLLRSPLGEATFIELGLEPASEKDADAVLLDRLSIAATWSAACARVALQTLTSAHMKCMVSSSQWLDLLMALSESLMDELDVRASLGTMWSAFMAACQSAGIDQWLEVSRRHSRHPTMKAVVNLSMLRTGFRPTCERWIAELKNGTFEQLVDLRDAIGELAGYLGMTIPEIVCDLEQRAAAVGASRVVHPLPNRSHQVVGASTEASTEWEQITHLFQGLSRARRQSGR